MIGSRALVASLLLAWAAAASDAGAPSAQAPTTGQLKVGGTLPIEGTTISIVFEAVQSDSRCPRDARCLRAGEAVVILLVQETGRESTSLTFHVPPGDGDARSAHGYRIEILRLDPQAETEVEIAQSDYVVTLRAGRP